jgi:site-specific DNA-cytosine methylase
VNGLALCAGIGGLELGLKLAPGDAYCTVCFVEIEAYAAACLGSCLEGAVLGEGWD